MPADEFWQFIRLSDYEKLLPSEPATAPLIRWRSRISSPIKEGRQKITGTLSGGTPQSVNIQKERLANKLLDNLVPPPEWNELDTPKIDEALDAWHNPNENSALADQSEGQHMVVVHAPHSGVREMTVARAQKRSWVPVSPPAPQRILDDDASWLEDLYSYTRECAQDDRRPVITHLEKCYLRRYDGLDLIRRIMNWLDERRYPCLVLCDSWAWAYLDSVLHLSTVLPEPYVLQPLDASKLTRWFGELSSNFGKRAVTFRKSNNRKIVIGPLRQSKWEDSEPEMQIEPRSVFMQYIAAYSRGNPGIAWAMWRQHLRLAQGEDSNRLLDVGATVWVRPKEELQQDLPKPLGEMDSANLFLLHTLLVHDGMSVQLLRAHLPMPVGEIYARLRLMQTWNLVDVDDGGRWRVTPLGHASVYRILSRRKLLVSTL